MGNLDTEVLIIRAGVLGAATAWELSRYKTDATLVDRCVDVDWGIAKANVGAVNRGGDTLEFRPDYRRSHLLWKSTGSLLLDVHCAKFLLQYMTAIVPRQLVGKYELLGRLVSGEHFPAERG
jgi:hypothetical protein